MSRLPNYEHEFDLLKIKLNDMFGISIEAFKASIKSLETLDNALAKKIVQNDNKIDCLNRKIENMSYEILGRFHPLASDLRRVVMTIKISGELERIADQAVNIAQVSEFMNGKNLLKSLDNIFKMAQITEEMARDSIKSYLNEDIELAKMVWLRDDEVDELDMNVMEDVKQIILKGGTEEIISQAERMILVSRAIERVADHVTNICEETVYMVTGKEIKEIIGENKNENCSNS